MGLIDEATFQAEPKHPGLEKYQPTEGFDPNWRPMTPYRLFVAAASGLAVAAGPSLAASSAKHTFDGVYLGKRVLKKGPAGQACPTEEDVSVTIHGETLTFTNSNAKKYIMPFYPRSDGSFGQIHTEGSFVFHYHGRIIGDVLDADVTQSPLRASLAPKERIIEARL